MVIQERARVAFDQIDVDGSGLLDRQELLRLNTVLNPGAPLLTDKSLTKVRAVIL